MRMLCKGKGHLESSLQNILNSGGEGVVLQKKASLYKPGRSETVIKLKVLSSNYISMLLVFTHS